MTDGGFSGWITPTYMGLDNNSLSQAQVDQILADFYDAFPTKSATNGILKVGGTNAAPSGTYQAATANPPTDGKEIAYELLNDSLGVSSKHWATVSFTA